MLLALSLAYHITLLFSFLGGVKLHTCCRGRRPLAGRLLAAEEDGEVARAPLRSGDHHHWNEEACAGEGGEARR